MEKVYIVNGWDGDLMVYHKQEDALAEFHRRLLIADGEEVLTFGADDYIEYRWYEDRNRQTYFLQFMATEVF